MNNDVRKIARQLVETQNRLRAELLEELIRYADEGDMDSAFDPYSYSQLGEEIRGKYLSNLQLINGLIQELAHCGQAGRQPPVKVLSLRAETSDRLVKLVNTTLARLNGARIMDIEFVQNQGNEKWVALITYMANPFTEEHDETAAFM